MIAERLRTARLQHLPPLSMEATAQRATALSKYHITRDMLGKIESNQRSVYDYEVCALALALEVDVRFLLGLIEEPNEGQPLRTPLDAQPG